MEMYGDMDKICYIVVGIGINANLRKRIFPGTYQTATSLYMGTGQAVDRRSVRSDYEGREYYYQYIKYGDLMLSMMRRYSATLNKPR